MDVARLEQSKIYIRWVLVFTGSAFYNILPSLAQVAAFEHLKISSMAVVLLVGLRTKRDSVHQLTEAVTDRSSHCEINVSTDYSDPIYFARNKNTRFGILKAMYIRCSLLAIVNLPSRRQAHNIRGYLSTSSGILYTEGEAVGSPNRP
jgi:hypothetical protein